MSALGRRTARLVAEARRLKAERHHQPQRITEVVVHCPVEAGDPRIGEEPLLVHAGSGWSPSIYEVFEATDAEEADL